MVYSVADPVPVPVPVPPLLLATPPAKLSSTLKPSKPSKKRVAVNNGLEDLPDRKKIRSELSTNDKLNKILQLEKQKQGKELNSAAKESMKRFRPTLRCLRKHFNGDVAQFAKEYPDYKHTTFA